MARKSGMLAELEKAANGESSAKVSAPEEAAPRVSNNQDNDKPKPRGRTGSSNPARPGKVNVTGYFDPAVKQSIRMIQAKFAERRTEQDLLAEALNDLFAKYNVPQSAQLSK